MLRRSRIKRITPLRASVPMRRGKTIRQGRPRLTEHADHLASVRALPCCARGLTVCHGIVSPHHDTAARGLGQKADDRRTMPLCFGHHRALHDGAGLFRGWTREQRRTWQQERIDETLMLVERGAGPVVMAFE